MTGRAISATKQLRSWKIGWSETSATHVRIISIMRLQTNKNDSGLLRQLLFRSLALCPVHRHVVHLFYFKSCIKLYYRLHIFYYITMLLLTKGSAVRSSHELPLGVIICLHSTYSVPIRPNSPDSYLIDSERERVWPQTRRRRRRRTSSAPPVPPSARQARPAPSRRWAAVSSLWSLRKIAQPGPLMQQASS